MTRAWLRDAALAALVIACALICFAAWTKYPT
jgi:hypothetical protein